VRSLVAGVLVFSFVIVSQLIVWRVRRPLGHYTALSALSLAVLILSPGIFYSVQSMISGSVRFLPITALDYWNFFVFYTALTLSYLVTYSAVQADSPTMTILLRIDQSGLDGHTLEEIMAELNDQVLVVPRLDDLVVGNLIELRGDRYAVTSRGALLAKIYIFYRALLKMERGG